VPSRHTSARRGGACTLLWRVGPLPLWDDPEKLPPKCKNHTKKNPERIPRGRKVLWLDRRSNKSLEKKAVKTEGGMRVMALLRVITNELHAKGFG